MILLESAMEGVAEDWTGKMRIDAWVQFQVSYYNEAYSVWEPVVEPVQRQPGQWDRWQLNAKVGFNRISWLCQESRSSFESLLKINKSNLVGFLNFPDYRKGSKTIIPSNFALKLT